MSVALWTSADAAKATGGRVTKEFSATGLSIDSRSIQPGDMFIALTDARDGHDFVADALKKGAAAALVSRIPKGCSEADPLLLVEDVLAALEALGRAGRARSAAKVVAVTGSVGKTSTKEMLRTVLAPMGRVHAAEASFNNHWGVPLTLARMPEATEFAVIEIGMNHPGEIAPLARLARPDVALITTIASAHIEFFENIEGIAREKASIFEGLVPGGIAVIPVGLKETPILAAVARNYAARVVTFGADKGADYRLSSVTFARDVSIVQALRGHQPMLFKVQSAGRHFAMNALGVLAVAEALGGDPAIVACDIGQWLPPAGRGKRERVILDIVDDHLAIDLIDDAYNANPASLAAALEVLAAAEPEDGVGRKREGRRIAILGDMLELGTDAEAQHAAIATHPLMATVHLVHCAGPLMKALWQALPEAKRGEWHPDAEAMVARAHLLIDAGDVVLVKGSKGSRITLMVDAIRKLGQADANRPQGVA